MSDKMNAMIEIEVAYARPEAQKVIRLSVAAGASVEEAITASGVLDLYPEIDLSVNRVGIYSHLCTLQTRLRARDRIEIYRPLLADPKEVRRRRAAEGKIMRGRRRNP